MKQLFQYNPYITSEFPGSLQVLDAFSVDDEGYLYYWRKNKWAITKLGAQIDGTREAPDFVIPVQIDDRLNGYAFDMEVDWEIPPDIQWNISPLPDKKQAKTAKECIRYIADHKYIEKIMWYNKEAQVADKIETVEYVVEQSMRTVLSYTTPDGKVYGMYIFKSISGYEQLMDLLMKYNERHNKTLK